MLIYSISNHEYGIYMSFSPALISRERNSNGWLNGIDGISVEVFRHIKFNGFVIAGEVDLHVITMCEPDLVGPVSLAVGHLGLFANGLAVFIDDKEIRAVIPAQIELAASIIIAYLRNVVQLRFLITDYQKKSVVDKLNVRIAEYAAFVMSSVLSMTSLTEGAEVGAYYDEPANNGIPRERIVRGTVLGEERFLFEYRLSSLGYDPSFCSLVFKQWDEIDFKKYLSFDSNAAFCFTIDNSKNSVNAVNVEFKYGSNRVLYKSVRMPLSEGVNELSIPLAPMNHKPLSEVSEISFVFWKQDRNDPDGEVILEGIKVRFAADTNIFTDD